MKVAIADDHLLILSTMESMVRATGYMELAGEYMTGAALIEGLKKVIPDVLLLDYHLPDQNGAQLARYITYHYPGIRILALTGFDKPGLATEMIENGCKGYMLKATANADLILDAINRVYHGHIYLDRSISEYYTSSICNNMLAGEEDRPKLTKRELEILQCIAAELSNQQISDKLGISKRTVENHRHSLTSKSGAKNTVGLIKFAIEMKLV